MRIVVNQDSNEHHYFAPVDESRSDKNVAPMRVIVESRNGKSRIHIKTALPTSLWLKLYASRKSFRNRVTGS
ncbi:MAG: hypothetical protein GC204_03380 [Chloroflexi bacterium]|nr:hypothetical protein [Chloroflexota bacterium]